MSAPSHVAFKRKLERLKGRFHGELVRILADRPRAKAKKADEASAHVRRQAAASKASSWEGLWSDFMRIADDFFAEAMELGVTEAESHLGNEIPDDLRDELRSIVEARLEQFRTVVDENLRDDVENGKYDDSEDPEHQALLEDQLDGRAGRYADALHPAAYEGMSKAATNAGVLMAWVLDPGADNCADCPELEAGSPYCDPDDEVEGATPLPTYPGDGDTDCRSECHCSLEFEEASWQEYVDAQDEAA